MEGYDSSTYGERFVDVYDEWYGDVSDTAGTVERIATLAGDGAVLELGIGTGRLALPLAAKGVDIAGVDTSPDMLDELRSKPGGAAVPVWVCDMATLDIDVPRPYRVVLVAFNTLFNLPTLDAQRRCFGRVADVLEPGGCFVVEGFLPADEPARPEGVVAPKEISADRVVLTVTRRDPSDQTIAGQHVEITEAGIRLRPWFLRYSRPAELDAVAAEAGLTLEERSGGWRGEPYADDGAAHVSIYRKP